MNYTLKVKNYNFNLFLVLFLFYYFIPNLYVLIDCILNNTEKGDFLGYNFSLSSFDMISLFILQSLLVLIIFILGVSFLKVKENRINLYVDKKIHYIVFIFLILNIIVLLETGLGKVAPQKERIQLSTLLNFFNISTFFCVIYFWISYNFKNKLFLINLFLYIILEFAKGWTGMFFFFFTFYFFKFLNRLNLKNRLIFFIIITLLAYIFGSAAYKEIYLIRELIRSVSFIEIDYNTALTKLMYRISFISRGFVAYENTDTIATLYQRQGKDLAEIYSFLRPSVPYFMFDKEFKIVNNLIIEAVYGFHTFGSSNFGLLPYLIVIFKIGIDIFLFYIVVAFVFIFFIRFIYSLFANKNNLQNLNFSFLSLLMIYSLNGSLETSFFNFVQIVYWMALLFSFGIIKIKIKKVLKYDLHYSCTSTTS